MTAAAYRQIVVGGDDAFDFLQGQLSNDLRRLATESRLLAAWCNPKGRVIALLRVDHGPAGYRLGLPRDLADEVLRRLTLFRFRAKVTFDTEAADARLLAGDAATDAFDLHEWQRSNLVQGVAEIGATQSEKYTPHMLNLDRLDALSLQKGCYTGQEVIARTHYRGASRRRLLRFVSATPLAAGDEVLADARKVGDVVNTIGTDLLAVVPADLPADQFEAGGAPLTPASLPYTLD
jgi:folate-binding protein YgfZ